MYAIKVIWQWIIETNLQISTKMWGLSQEYAGTKLFIFAYKVKSNCIVIISKVVDIKYH